jgi:hypothetical protein
MCLCKAFLPGGVASELTTKACKNFTPTCP